MCMDKESPVIILLYQLVVFRNNPVNLNWKIVQLLSRIVNTVEDGGSPVGLTVKDII